MNHDCQKDEIIATIKKDIDNLFAVKDVVIEMKTLVAMQSEQNKKQDDMLNKQSELLTKLTNSVEQQSILLVKLSEKHDELDSKFVQKSIDELKENSITFNALIRMAIDKALPPIIVAGLTYFILQVVNK
jgi:septal ring factor EnvC (AmiA/AmiB activator)